MIYGTEQAAEYLGLSVPGVKYHVYTTKRLTPQLVGKSLVFTREQLDEFNATRRGPGRPRKENNVI
jgi:hypothetical protein